MTETILCHPTLGKLRGIKSSDGNTTQFRGIKYASIPGRWRDPVLLDSLPKKYEENEFDATKHGPQCPQHPSCFDFDVSLVGNNLGLKLEGEDPDEFECLNLVITIPEGVKEGIALPVMVFVHGGGFVYGANSWPQYDLTRFVTTSAEISKPIIGVSINYRLGPFGWLASSELGTDGNYGLKDQACAFQWIRKHISSFGGNPSQMTVFGESAGSICISHHLLRPVSLFNQAILMSGDSTLRRARGMSWQNALYSSNLSLLELENHPVKERTEIIRSLPAADLIARLPMFQHWSPTIDGVFIREHVELGNIGKEKMWCERILMGDCAHDGTILKARIITHPDILPRLQSALQATLTPTQSHQLLRTYRLPPSLSSSPPPNQAALFHPLLTLSSDLRFYFPVLMWEQGIQTRPNPSGSAKEKTSLTRYHFHHPNPTPGETQGLAGHELDLYVLLGNARRLREGREDGLGRRMRQAFLGWVYGAVDGKESGRGEKEVLVLGSEEGGKGGMRWVGKEEYDVRYRGGRGEMLRAFGCERVARLGEMVQGCWDGEEYAEERRRKRRVSKL